MRLLGTPFSAIHQAEDREAFHALCQRLGIPQPEGRVAQSPEEALRLAPEVGFPSSSARATSWGAGHAGGAGRGGA